MHSIERSERGRDAKFFEKKFEKVLDKCGGAVLLSKKPMR